MDAIMILKNNENLQNMKDFEYAIKLTRMLLVPCGIWPVKLFPTYETIIRPILVVMSFFLMLFVMIPMCLFMFLIIKDSKIRIKICASLGFSFMIFFKYVMVIARKHQIANCFNKIANDWQTMEDSTDRKIMLANARTGRILTIFCILLMYGGGMPYVTIMPISRGVTIIGNVTRRHFAYPSYFIFFNPNVRPVYDIIYLTHCLCGFLRCTITCGINSTFILFVMHICSEIGISSIMMEKLADNFDRKLLGLIVKQHLQFLKFAKILEDIFQEVCLVEVFGSTYIICFLGHSLITEYEQREAIATITYLLLLISSVFNIFILCYIGEILTEKCESMGTTAYMINWYKLSGKEAKNIIMLVSSKQRPVALTAGKIMNLSLKSFSDIMQAAASYLNMIRTVIASGT